jgi:hypothetical protein
MTPGPKIHLAPAREDITIVGTPVSFESPPRQEHGTSRSRDTALRARAVDARTVGDPETTVDLRWAQGIRKWVRSQPGSSSLSSNSAVSVEVTVKVGHMALATAMLVPGAGAALDQRDLGVTVCLCHRSAGQDGGFTAEPIMIDLLRVDTARRAEEPRFDVFIPHNAAADGSGRRAFQSLVA